MAFFWLEMDDMIFGGEKGLAIFHASTTDTH